MIEIEMLVIKSGSHENRESGKGLRFQLDEKKKM